MGLVVRQKQELIHRLGNGVVPSAFGGRPVDDVIVLAEGNADALAVHLARRGDEDATAKLRCRAQCHLAPYDVRFDRADRIVDDELHADRGREVINHIDTRDDALELRILGKVADDILEAAAAEAASQVLHAARGEIVPDNDLLPER
jgi:hypothetical protein